MTRYLCVDPRHERNGEQLTVDLTAQVRLERALVPRTSVYLALTEHVIGGVRDLPPIGDRPRAVVEILTGTPYPADLPVLLMSEHAVSRPPGLYELDDLRHAEPAIDRLVPTYGYSDIEPSGSGDLLLLQDGRASESSSSSALMTKEAQRTRAIPQGVFPLESLSERLAAAPSRQEESLEAAIRETSWDLVDSTHEPWRVVVRCPVAEGEPPTQHETVFTGTGEPEAAVVYGVPADGWDSVLEASASQDLSPAVATARADRRIMALLAAEVMMAALVVGIAWASGGLALASRETPVWLGASVTLALGAMLFAALPLLNAGDPEGNPNDTFVLAVFYESRLELMRWVAAISVALFAFALLTGLVPPVLASGNNLPTPVVTFDDSNTPVTATVRLHASGLARDEALLIEVRQFGFSDTTGTLIATTRAAPDAAGVADVRENAALDAGARYVSVLVTKEGTPRAACTPTLSTGPGCTVAAAPPLGAGLVQSPGVIVVPGITVSPAPTSSPPPTQSPTP
jgi:hypothetical protein